MSLLLQTTINQRDLVVTRDGGGNISCVLGQRHRRTQMMLDGKFDCCFCCNSVASNKLTRLFSVNLDRKYDNYLSVGCCRFIFWWWSCCGSRETIGGADNGFAVFLSPEMNLRVYFLSPYIQNTTITWVLVVLSSFCGGGAVTGLFWWLRTYINVAGTACRNGFSMEHVELLLVPTLLQPQLGTDIIENVISAVKVLSGCKSSINRNNSVVVINVSSIALWLSPSLLWCCQATNSLLSWLFSFRYSLNNSIPM